MHSMFSLIGILRGLEETKALHPLSICLLRQPGKPQGMEHREKAVSGGVTVFGCWAEARGSQGVQGKSRIDSLKEKEGGFKK